MNYLLPERLDRIAREYVLGTLSGGARRRFERVLATSPLALQAVQGWQRRLAILEGANVPLTPPASNWAAIERRLFPAAVVERTAPPPGRGVLGFLASLVSGRALAGAFAGALACVLVVRMAPGLAGLEPAAETLPPSYVGLLEDAAGHPSLVVSSRRLGRVATLKLLRPVDVPAGHVAELWALPADGKAFPVGVLPRQGSVQVDLPDTSEKLFAKVSSLGVSIEAAPAAPGGAPTSPFVLTGHCVKVW